jgi:hypothetical protein
VSTARRTFTATMLNSSLGTIAVSRELVAAPFDEGSHYG